MKRPPNGDRYTYCTECTSPTDLKLEYFDLIDTVEDVVQTELHGFLSGDHDSSLIVEAACWRIINQARRTRQARHAA